MNIVETSISSNFIERKQKKPNKKFTKCDLSVNIVETLISSNFIERKQKTKQKSSFFFLLTF